MLYRLLIIATLFSFQRLEAVGYESAYAGPGLGCDLLVQVRRDNTRNRMIFGTKGYHDVDFKINMELDINEYNALVDEFFSYAMEHSFKKYRSRNQVCSLVYKQTNNRDPERKKLLLEKHKSDFKKVFLKNLRKNTVFENVKGCEKIVDYISKLYIKNAFQEKKANTELFITSYGNCITRKLNIVYPE